MTAIRPPLTAPTPVAVMTSTTASSRICLHPRSTATPRAPAQAVAAVAALLRSHLHVLASMHTALLLLLVHLVLPTMCQKTKLTVMVVMRMTVPGLTQLDCGRLLAQEKLAPHCTLTPTPTVHCVQTMTTSRQRHLMVNLCMMVASVAPGSAGVTTDPRTACLPAPTAEARVAVVEVPHRVPTEVMPQLIVSMMRRQGPVDSTHPLHGDSLATAAMPAVSRTTALVAKSHSSRTCRVRGRLLRLVDATQPASSPGHIMVMFPQHYQLRSQHPLETRRTTMLLGPSIHSLRLAMETQATAHSLAMVQLAAQFVRLVSTEPLQGVRILVPVQRQYHSLPVCLPAALGNQHHLAQRLVRELQS